MEVKVPYRVALNLLPRKYIARRTPNWVRLFFVILLLLFSMFYLYSYAELGFRIQSLGQEIGNLRIQVTRLREEEQRLKRVQSELTKIEQRVHLLESLIKQEKDWLQLFTIFGRHMPPDLALFEIRCSPERIECRGRSGTVASIADFISSLSQYTNLFTSVDFTSLSLGRDNLYEFGLIMELKSR